MGSNIKPNKTELMAIADAERRAKRRGKIASAAMTEREAQLRKEGFVKRMISARMAREVKGMPRQRRAKNERTKTMRTPPSMEALVLASKLDLAENTSGTFPCPSCGSTFTAYRSANGKLSGKCDRCSCAIPRG